MAKCLVLGGGGFIGGHVVSALLRDGHTVRAFERPRPGSASRAQQTGVEVFEGDFLDSDSLDAALDGMEYVFHLISTTNPAVSVKDPLVDVETNLKMSVILFELCVKHRVKRVIFPSTGGAIYGQNLDRALTEQDPTEPITPYGICKLAIENYLRFFKHTHGLNYLALRISNPYGEQQNLVGSQGVVPIFMDLIRQGKPLVMYGDGSTVRDYIYVRDLADSMVRIFELPAEYDVYNMGSGEGLSLENLVQKIESVTGIKADIDRRPERASDVKRVLLDVTRYENEFGKLAKTDVDTALKATWEYVQKEAQR